MSVFIRVPASTANLGPGFDSIGLAVARYLEIEAERSDSWTFNHQSKQLESLPNDHTHYIAKMSDYFCSTLEVEKLCLNVKMKSDIPLARGLGSSGTALIASLLLVDYFHDLKLSEDEKIALLSKVEGHPDNITPSLIGGLVVGYYDGKHCFTQSLPVIDWPLYVIVPDYELKTVDARNTLPTALDYKDAVIASAVSNVLIAALAQKNYNLAGEMMMKDRFHEPYRQQLIQEYEEVRKTVDGHGYAFISGAGPTMMLMIQPGHEEVIQTLKKKLTNCHISHIDIDKKGSLCETKLNMI